MRILTIVQVATCIALFVIYNHGALPLASFLQAVR